jgi:hypothetical protein
MHRRTDPSDFLTNTGTKLLEDSRCKLQDLICKWKAVFSTGPTGLGYTRLVGHEINLTDDKPYREPYRRIPPSMFDEVRNQYVS